MLTRVVSRNLRDLTRISNFCTLTQPLFQPSMKLLMTAKKDKGRYIIAMNPEYLKRGEPSTLGKVKAVAQRRQYIVYDNGFKANKTL